MSHQLTLLDSLSATSSPASEDGATPSGLQASAMKRRYGRALALASLSARQAKERGLLTSGTSGRLGSISSSSASLTSFLANRVAQRLSGSTLFALTWKRSGTPQERLIYRLRASVRRTSDNDCGSWPTPNAGPLNDTDTNWQERRRECKERHQNGNGFGINLGMAAQLASSWTTPTARDWKDSPGMSTEATNPDGSRRSRTDLLPRQAHLATWATPTVEASQCAGAHNGKAATPAQKGYNAAGNTDSSRRTVELSGQTATGSTAPTGSIGQLNPEHPRWLMGYPKEFCESAVTAMQSCPK